MCDWLQPQAYTPQVELAETNDTNCADQAEGFESGRPQFLLSVTLSHERLTMERKQQTRRS